MKARILATASIAALIGVSSARAEPYRVRVVIDNLAPDMATFQTPHWVGVHDGEAFDIYNGGTPASMLPVPNSVAVERLVEDGNTGPLASDFALLAPAGGDATLPGPGGPIGPGQKARGYFIIESDDPNTRYFSYYQNAERPHSRSVDARLI